MTTAEETEVQEAPAVEDVVDGAVEAAPARERTTYEECWEQNPGMPMELATEEIGIRPEDNGRMYTAQAGDKKLASLVTSIAKDGQDTPVKIRLIDGMPFLVYGFRRYAAIQTINESRKKNNRMLVRCELASGKDGAELDDRGAFVKNAVENIQREDLTAIDKLLIFERLTKPVEDGGFGMKHADAATEVGVGRSTLTMFLKHLSPLNEQSKKAIASGDVGAFLAIELGTNGMEPAKIDEEIARIVAEKKAGGKSASSVRKARAKGRKEKEGKGGDSSKGKLRTVREMIDDLSEEVVRESEYATAAKAVLLQYVRGKLKFDTMLRKLEEAAG